MNAQIIIEAEKDFKVREQPLDGKKLRLGHPRKKAIKYLAYKCDICGLDPNNLYYATLKEVKQVLGKNMVLEVHHKDLNPANNKLENLQLLCNTCHKIIHSHKCNTEERQKERFEERIKSLRKFYRKFAPWTETHKPPDIYK